MSSILKYQINILGCPKRAVVKIFYFQYRHAFTTGDPASPEGIPLGERGMTPFPSFPDLGIEVLSIMKFPYLRPEKKLTSILLGFVSTNYQREIELRNMVGARVTYQHLNIKNI